MGYASDQDVDNGNGCSADQQPLMEDMLSQESPGSIPVDRNQPRHVSADEWVSTEGEDDCADFVPASSRRNLFEDSSDGTMQHEIRKAASTSTSAPGSSSEPCANVPPSAIAKSGRYYSSILTVSITRISYDMGEVSSKAPSMWAIPY